MIDELSVEDRRDYLIKVTGKSGGKRALPQGQFLLARTEEEARRQLWAFYLTNNEDLSVQLIRQGVHPEEVMELSAKKKEKPYSKKSTKRGRGKQSSGESSGRQEELNLTRSSAY